MIVEVKPVQISINAKTPKIDAELSTPIVKEYVERDPYTGDYTVTPSAETQTLLTKNKRMTDHIVINPIPSNYGLITWNGATLTVS